MYTWERKEITFLTVLLLLAALPASSAGTCSRPDPRDVVEVEPHAVALSFHPLESFASTLLRVTGPWGLAFEKSFAKGETPVFELDETTADGCYTFEVRAVPILSPEIREALEHARARGDTDEIWRLRREGKLPEYARTQSGGFQVVDGRVVLDFAPEKGGEKSAAVSDGFGALRGADPRMPGAAPMTPIDGIPRKDYVYYNDLIVVGSTCVGFDCVDGFDFDYTTLALSENNTRIKFDDTSTTASYPRNDWWLAANDSVNGGASRFSIEDCGDDAAGNCTSPLRPFIVEATAPSHSLYVDDSGRLGLGTSTPYVEIHAVDGDTPTVRLDQDGTSGFARQVWDVAGNETNFFIRDVTHGSKLTLRIRPGAPTSSIDVASDGDVGLGTASPSGPLHVQRSTAGGKDMLHLENNGPSRFLLENTSASSEWRFNADDSADLRIAENNTNSDIELILTDTGDLTITGDLVTGGGGACDPGPCDGVFTDYELESIDEHADFMWRHHHLWGVGPTPEGEPINLTRKLTGILHELEKAHIYIEQLHQRVRELEERLDPAATAAPN